MLERTCREGRGTSVLVTRNASTVLVPGMLVPGGWCLRIFVYE